MTNQSDEDNLRYEGVKLYVSFSGVLMGFSTALITLLLTLTLDKYRSSPFFEYAIAAFVFSALSYLQNIEWFIYFIRSKKDLHYNIGSYAYYLGYLSMILGIAYMLKLFEIKLALYLIYSFLLYTVFITAQDFYLDLKKERRSIDILISPAVIIIYILIIWFTLIN